MAVGPLPPNRSGAEFVNRLNKLVAHAQVLHDAVIRPAPGLPGDEIMVTKLRRYLRVEKVRRNNEADRSVYAFIDPENGDIYKAESWSRPAAKVRGNLYEPDNGFGCLNWHGAK